MELARRQFTIEEYLAMAETGILREGERVELIDGAVVAMSPFNDPHRLTLNRLTRLLTTQFPEPYVVQIQMTMALGTGSSTWSTIASKPSATRAPADTRPRERSPATSRSRRRSSTRR
ncbi:MAG: Uma2 family endonuclease [Vulcanimicrobiaceae bacterium]